MSNAAFGWSRFVGVGLACGLIARPVVAGDLHVAAASAVENADGTTGHPFPTLGAALGRVKPGDRVVVHAGVYREGVQLKASGTAEQPIEIAAAPGEHVVVSGADAVSGWQKAAVPATAPNGRPSNKPILWQKAPFPAWAAYGANVGTRLREPQLIIDGVMYRHLPDRAGLFPGTFCYEPQNDGAIVVSLLPTAAKSSHAVPAAAFWDEPVDLSSDDPNLHRVEASVRDTLLTTGEQQYVHVSGLTFRYTSAAGQVPAVRVGPTPQQPGRHVTVDHCTFERCNGSGLFACGDDITIRDNVARYNGGEGMGGRLTRSLFEGNTLLNNTANGYSHGWEAGGVKMLDTVKTVVRGNKFVGNDGPGFWFDTGNSDNVVERNLCVGNWGAGIMVEVSPNYTGTGPDAKPQMSAIAARIMGIDPNTPPGPNVVRNNVCTNTHWDGCSGVGIQLQLSSYVTVANNTVMGNEQCGIFVRYHPYDVEGHRCVHDTLLNNLCADNGQDEIFITPEPKDRPAFVADNASDYNLMFDTDTWLHHNQTSQQLDSDFNRARYAKWGKTQSMGTYSAEEWFKIRGFDEHAVQGDPLLVSKDLMDLRLMSGSPAIGAGTATDCVTDDFLGRSRPKDRAPSIGAFEYVEDDAASNTPVPVLASK